MLAGEGGGAVGLEAGGGGGGRLEEDEGMMSVPLGPMMRTRSSPAPAPVASTQKLLSKRLRTPPLWMPGPHTLTLPCTYVSLMSML